MSSRFLYLCTMTHTVCRRPAVTFPLPGETCTPPVYHPHRGEHYVIEGNGPGGYRVVQK